MEEHDNARRAREGWQDVVLHVHVLSALDIDHQACGCKALELKTTFVRSASHRSSNAFRTRSPAGVAVPYAGVNTCLQVASLRSQLSARRTHTNGVRDEGVGAWRKRSRGRRKTRTVQELKVPGVICTQFGHSQHLNVELTWLSRLLS